MKKVFKIIINYKKLFALSANFKDIMQIYCPENSYNS